MLFGRSAWAMGGGGGVTGVGAGRAGARVGARAHAAPAHTRRTIVAAVAGGMPRMAAHAAAHTRCPPTVRITS